MESEHKAMPSSLALLLVVLMMVVGGIVGALGMSDLKDREFAKQRAEQAQPLTLGAGQVLKANGVVVVLGPVTANDRNAAMPIYVEENTVPPKVVLSCLVLDEKKRLLAGGGLTVPPRFIGTDLAVQLPHSITGGSVQCRLVKP